MIACRKMFAVFWVDGRVTQKVLENLKWRPSMEKAWKSLLRNVTFLWLLSRGWANKQGGEERGIKWFEENYRVVKGAVAVHKGIPQKAYLFKHTITFGGGRGWRDQWFWWSKLRMTCAVHNMCWRASVVPQILPNQIWTVFCCQNSYCLKSLPPPPPTQKDWSIKTHVVIQK